MARGNSGPACAVGAPKFATSKVHRAVKCKQLSATLAPSHQPSCVHYYIQRTARNNNTWLKTSCKPAEHFPRHGSLPNHRLWVKHCWAGCNSSVGHLLLARAQARVPSATVLKDPCTPHHAYRYLVAAIPTETATQTLPRCRQAQTRRRCPAQAWCRQTPLQLAGMS